jgi:hypothetical protein
VLDCDAYPDPSVARASVDKQLKGLCADFDRSAVERYDVGGGHISYGACSLPRTKPVRLDNVIRAGAGRNMVLQRYSDRSRSLVSCRYSTGREAGRREGESELREVNHSVDSASRRRVLLRQKSYFQPRFYTQQHARLRTGGATVQRKWGSH